MSAVCTVMAFVAPVYKASVRMVIEKSVNRYMQSNKLVDGPTFDDADTWSQILIISSESIILPVVKNLNLAADNDIVGVKNTDSITSRGLRLARDFKELVGLKSAAADERADPERQAFDSINRNLSVYREDGPNVINISFESANPRKAAAIANAIADTYLASTAGSKVNSTQIAGRLMQDRLGELKMQAANAERAVLEYKTANNLISTGAKTMSSEQVNSLSAHLAKARVDMAESRARFERAGQGDDALAQAAFTPDNELITRLRTQYLELTSRATEIGRRVGNGHAAVTKLHQRMEETRRWLISQRRPAPPFPARIDQCIAVPPLEAKPARARNSALTLAMPDAFESPGPVPPASLPST